MSPTRIIAHPQRAVCFQLPDEAQRRIAEVLTDRHVEVWEEKNLRDLRTAIRDKNVDYVFIGSEYLLKRSPEIISSLKRSSDALSIILTAPLDHREKLHSYLSEQVSCCLYEPYHPKEILFSVRSAAKMRRMAFQSLSAQELLGHMVDPQKVFIGRSANVVEIRRTIIHAKKNKNPVYIVGESGCGKTQISYAIHFVVPGVFLPIRVYDPVAEPERGRGLIKYLEGFPSSGTLVIRNSQHLAPNEVEKVSEIVTESANAKNSFPRLILHHNPSRGLPERFGQYPSLTPIEVLPLRERNEDITPLSNYFISTFSEVLALPKATIAASTRKVLMNYSWPDNVNGLFSAIFYGMINTGEDIIYPFNLPDYITTQDSHALDKVSLGDFLSAKLKPLISRMNLDRMEGLHPIIMGMVEAPLITMVLRKTGGNQSKTANILGINRNTLRKKIVEYRINIQWDKDSL
jgi:DNA-binding NtrC family response regulator